MIFSLLVLDERDVRYLDHPVSYYFNVLSEVNDSLKLCDSEKSAASVIVTQKNLFETVKAVFKMLFLSENLKMIIVKSIESPNRLIEEIKEIRKEIASQISSLESAAVAFQSGRDSEGAGLLQVFIDFIYRYIRVCHQISPVFGIDLATIEFNEKNLEDLNGTIYSLLEEIVSVMENGDIISLSDILEYQMKVELEKTSAYIDLLLEKIG